MRLSSGLAVGSPTVRVSAILVATVLLTLMVAAVGVAGSRLLAADGAIVVDPSGGGDFTTITEAVGVAVDGDTILIKPGIYDESIVLTRSITVRGDGDRDAIIIEPSEVIPHGASGDGPDLPLAFRFDGSDAIVENLTLRGESARVFISGGAPMLRDLVFDGVGRVYSLDPGQPTPTGLGFSDGTTATLTNSVLTDTDIDIETGSSPSIVGNEFSIGAIWMQGTGVDPEIRDNVMDGSVKWGVSIGGGAQPMVVNNIISGASTAIEIADTGWLIPDTGTNPVIRGNTVSDATSAGLSVGTRASAIIEDNEFTGNQTGLEVRGSGVILTGNVIREGRTGVNLAGGGSPILEGNLIEGTEFGLMVGSGTTPTLTGNTICDNEQNLLLSGSAEMPAIEGNEICDVAPAA